MICKLELLIMQVSCHISIPNLNNFQLVLQWKLQKWQGKVFFHGFPTFSNFQLRFATFFYVGAFGKLGFDQYCSIIDPG